MKCRNLHCHPIDIYMMKNKKFYKETTLSKYSYLNPKIKLQKNLHHLSNVIPYIIFYIYT